MILSGANTYATGTIISKGTLQLGAANVLYNAAFVSIANDSTAVLDLNDFDDAIGTLVGGGSAGGNIDLGSGDLITYSITRHGGASQNSSYAGIITGSGSFTKSGWGILTLTGDSDYSGGTAISNGGLRIEGTSTLASTTVVTMESTARFILGGDTQQQIGGLVSSSTLTPKLNCTHANATLNTNSI